MIEWGLNILLGCFAVSQYTAHRMAQETMALGPKIPLVMVRRHTTSVIEMLTGACLTVTFHQLNESKEPWQELLVVWMMWITAVQAVLYINFKKEGKQHEETDKR